MKVYTGTANTKLKIVVTWGGSGGKVYRGCNELNVNDPRNSYAAVITPNVTVFGNGAFGR